jgi:hypothetical protein
MHDRCTVCAHPMVLLGDVGQAEARFGPFGDSVNSAQDRYMVCAECTMGMEIILGTSNGTPRCCVSSGSSFRSVWRYY